MIRDTKAVNEARAQIARRRSAPPGGRESYMTAADGARIRYWRWRVNAAPLGTVVVLGGRTEFIEKHFETYADLIDAGYDVVAMDWRGQGLSGRTTAHASKDHVISFSARVNDLAELVTTRLYGHMARPFFAMGHSMGGHLLARYLHDFPGRLDGAVLSSPMMEIAMTEPVRKLAVGLTRLTHGVGLSSRFGPGQKAYGKDDEGEEVQRRLTNDKDRFQDQVAAIHANPALGLGGVSFGWLRAALISCAEITQPHYARAIETPMLIAMAGQDVIVENQAARMFAENAPNAETVWLEAAAHEIWKERTPLRAYFLRRTLRFFESVRS